MDSGLQYRRRCVVVRLGLGSPCNDLQGRVREGRIWFRFLKAPSRALHPHPPPQMLRYTVPFMVISGLFWMIHTWILDPLPNKFRRQEFIRCVCVS